MKAYKLEVLIIDFDELGAGEIVVVLENTKYPNHCISPDVMKVTGVDIGEWDDDHPLNLNDKRRAEYNKLFNEDAQSDAAGQKELRYREALEKIARTSTTKEYCHELALKALQEEGK